MVADRQKTHCLLERKSLSFSLGITFPLDIGDLISVRGSYISNLFKMGAVPILDSKYLAVEKVLTQGE